MAALLVCPICNEEIGQATDRCLTCGADIGAPNVRVATSDVELVALQTRYDDAIHRAKARGAGSTLQAFEKALLNGGAIINCNLPFLKDFVSQSKTLYSNYHLGVQGQTRKAAAAEDDQHRSVVDAIMFRSSYASAIRFAALSLDSRGLISYGPYALRLRAVAVSHRASLLEENSFDFVDHHHLGAKTPIPPGYRSDWNGKDRLAVAKLGDFLDVGPQKGGFSKLVLSSDGNYQNDRFLEVYIFGTFDFSAVETISGPKPKKAADKAIWSAVKEAATRSGKGVDEY